MIRDILFDIAPEFKTSDPAELARVDRIISYAATEINRNIWGNRADRGTALLAAHMLTVADRGGNGASGPVVKEAAGGRTIEYARTQPGAGLADPYATTGYGQEYKRLLALLDAGPILL